MPDQDERQQMLEAEARYWLARGYTSKAKVDELSELLGKKRGADAVQRLVAEMRRQWPRRAEWMERSNG